jgi:uncharacterized protein (DUF885 family)
MRRWIAVVALLVVVSGGAFLHAAVWGKPWSIDQFFSRVFLEFALERPLVLSQLRILEPYGVTWHTDELDDFSLEFERDEIRELEHNLEVLRSYDRASLAPEQRESRDVLEWFLQVQADRAPFLLHDFPVNQMNGVQTGLVDFMLSIHQINEEQEAEDYVARLRAFGPAFDQVIEGMDARQRAGILPPRFVIERVRFDLEQFLRSEPADNILVMHLQDAVAGLDGLSDARRADLIDGALSAVSDVVYPVLRRLDAELERDAAEAGDEVGAWRLPDGDAYYAWQVRRHTTTDLTAEEIHEIGLAEVARIAAEMRAILSEHGVPSEDLAPSLRELSTAPRFQYPDDEAGRDAILEDYRAIVAETEAKLPELFGRLPKAQVQVERVPEFMQGGAPVAYYSPPSFDGSRPGIFYVNLRNPAENPKWRMRTLAHHEATPGHHLQISLAQEIEGLPFFRRILPFTAYAEGWALYAERLAGEHGLLPTPLDHLGALVDEMFRAVRLVVDTGIHAKRWSRERAIGYLESHTGKPISEVVAEVDRYIVMPGQALAYKIGQLEILAYRDRARRELGDAFDLRGFHDLLLGGGGMPLELLERKVDEWISEKKGG